MDAELKLLESEELQFEDNYFPAYNEAKRYLRETRQGLRKLAGRTVTEVRDLRILLEDLDKDEDPVLLKASLDKMKGLMIETPKTLKEALEKYNSAVETFDNLNSSIATQNRKLVKMRTKTLQSIKSGRKIRGQGSSEPSEQRQRAVSLPMPSELLESVQPSKSLSLLQPLRELRLRLPNTERPLKN